MSRVFATALGDQNMVIEDVMIETETTGRKRLRSTEVLVFSVRPRNRRRPLLAVSEAVSGL